MKKINPSVEKKKKKKKKKKNYLANINERWISVHQEGRPWNIRHPRSFRDRVVHGNTQKQKNEQEQDQSVISLVWHFFLGGALFFWRVFLFLLVFCHVKRHIRG